MQSTSTPQRGELGTIRSHGITHGDFVATVHFPTLGDLEIPAEPTFIHVLEANLEANWTDTGPDFAMGDKIITLQGLAGPGVVHGFMTQNDGSIAVLIWFNETDKYMQIRPYQIQKENAALPTAESRTLPLGQPSTAQTCISGCTLLGLAPSCKLQPPGGILMREVRPGTRLLNAKGKEVMVTNVYFSRENAVMVQISEHCHTTITHPLVDTHKPKQGNRDRSNPTTTIVAAAEWYTRRRNHFYRSTPRGTPPLLPSDHQVEYHLHYSSPQNLRKSGDLWGFSTQDNQPVRSFDDPSCLICPIGHIGWAQVDIATAILSCWGRPRHLPYPRPDLAEFQEQTEAIHAFLRRPEAVKKLEDKRRRIDPGTTSARNKRPIEFTNGHLQLECLRGRWLVRMTFTYMSPSQYK